MTDESDNRPFDATLDNLKALLASDTLLHDDEMACFAYSLESLGHLFRACAEKGRMDEEDIEALRVRVDRLSARIELITTCA